MHESATQSYCTPPYSVLYVDDDPSLLEIGKIFLERAGDITVTLSQDPVLAVEKIRMNRFDAIISDYQMPGMNGIELLVRVRESGDTTPFIIFTGKGREEVVIEALNNGADHYVQKGGNPKAQFAELTHKIRRSVLWRRALEEIAGNEERYRQISDVMSDLACSCIRSADGACVTDWMVGAVFEITGYTPAEIEAEGGCSFLIHPDDREYYHHQILTLSPGSTASFEVRITSRVRSIRWVSVSARCIGGAEGSDRLYIGCRDITDERRVKMALAENLTQLEAAMDAGNLAWWGLDMETGSLTFCDRFARIFEYAPKRVTHYTEFMGLLHPDDHEVIRQALYSHLDGHKSRYEAECRVKRADGSYLWLQIIGRRSEDPQSSRSIRVTGTVADISARKRYEEALQEKHESLLAINEELIAAEEEIRQQMDEIVATEQSLLASQRQFSDIITFLPDPTFIINASGVVIAWNRAMEQLTGISAEAMEGQSGYAYACPLYGRPRPMLIDLVMQPDNPEIRSWYDSIHQNGATTIGEIAYRHPDGRQLILWGKAAPLYGGKGDLIGAIESIRDITAIKMALKRLEEKNLELLSANERLAAAEEEIRQQMDEIVAMQTREK
ncbi:MAG: PAS domain S-box protein [Methanocalculus sp.]|uniref:hybrid sensor histidine kinase/response regulator n=1 Tax=Methanocalculus sp. TaxID=2004547 RepID=UPI002715E7FF|nr:GGDEF domain-containing response regulator [Methanocalculus sp.]MDO9538408.1 PAS domain S-box protein [Methanocalculus sp.]